MIPIERVKQTPLNAVPLAIEPVRLADGGLYLGRLASIEKGSR